MSDVLSDVLRKTFDKMLEAKYEALSEEDKECISLEEYKELFFSKFYPKGLWKIYYITFFYYIFYFFLLLFFSCLFFPPYMMRKNILASFF